MSAKTELSKLLKDSNTVLVLGDGLNIQAAQSQGRDKIENWHQTLQGLSQQGDENILELNPAASTPARWDRLVSRRSAAHDHDRGRAEQSLQETLSKRLHQLEAVEETSDLYSAILAPRFEHIISFNVDRRLIKHEPNAELNVEKSRYPLLSRHWQMSETDRYGYKRTRTVWFPYGDSSNPASIQLGHSTYDARLMTLEDYRKDFMEEWFLRLEEIGYFNFSDLHTPKEVYEDLVRAGRGRGIDTWVDLFLLAPLVFIGVSLSLDDWPLWWLLHQRARNFVPFQEEDYPDTYYLGSKTDPCDYLVGSPAGIEVVEFNTFDAMWEFVLRAIKSPSRE